MKTELTDGTITLRRTLTTDAEAIYAAVDETRADLTPWIPWYHDNYSLEDSKSWLETRDEAWNNGTEYDLAIVDAATGEYIGGTGVVSVNKMHNRGEIGYWIRTSRAGRGVAPAAAKLAARFAFEELGLDRICLNIAADNTRSRRVADKIGAKLEGILRSYYTLRGVRHDAVVYSILKGEL